MPLLPEAALLAEDLEHRGFERIRDGTMRLGDIDVVLLLAVGAQAP